MRGNAGRGSWLRRWTLRALLAAGLAGAVPAQAPAFVYVTNQPASPNGSVSQYDTIGGAPLRMRSTSVDALTCEPGAQSIRRGGWTSVARL